MISSIVGWTIVSSGSGIRGKKRVNSGEPNEKVCQELSRTCPYVKTGVSDRKSIIILRKIFFGISFKV